MFQGMLSPMLEFIGHAMESLSAYLPSSVNMLFELRYALMEETGDGGGNKM
jgi:hypothetical protein